MSKFNSLFAYMHSNCWQFPCMQTQCLVLPEAKLSQNQTEYFPQKHSKTVKRICLRQFFQVLKEMKIIVTTFSPPSQNTKSDTSGLLWNKDHSKREKIDNFVRDGKPLFLGDLDEPTFITTFTFWKALIENDYFSTLFL